MQEGSSLEQRIPEPPTYAGERYGTIEAALASGPKTLQALMAAVGSRDGHEIVRKLEALRVSGRLDRDAAGAWQLSS